MDPKHPSSPLSFCISLNIYQNFSIVCVLNGCKMQKLMGVLDGFGSFRTAWITPSLLLKGQIVGLSCSSLYILLEDIVIRNSAYCSLLQNWKQATWRIWVTFGQYWWQYLIYYILTLCTYVKLIFLCLI